MATAISSCSIFTKDRNKVVIYFIPYSEFDFHSLRHTHATMLAEANLPIKYVQNRLGHSKVEITMNVYQHLTDTISEKGTNMLNDMFKNEMSALNCAAHFEGKR